MKQNVGYQRSRHEQAFAALQGNLSELNLSPELIQELIDRHIPVSFEKGAMLFCEGNTDGMLACMLTGYVRIYCPVGDGSRTLVRLAGPGELIGYPDYIDDRGRHARMFEAQAATKCVVALFSREQIAALLSTLPSHHLVSILSALNTFWSENLRFFASLLSLPLYDRLKIVISDLAARAGVQDSEGVILIPEIGHEDLAEMIGCSRPMVSRMIADLVDARQITKRGKQYILLKRWDADNQSRSSGLASKELRSPSGGRSTTREFGSLAAAPA
jgi:CRP/FNR family transcriptional regulator, cyclic AMP receptor protein